MSILQRLLKKLAGTNIIERNAQEISLKNKGLGDRGEDIAADFLTERGFRIVERNFSAAGGEIDIIAEKDGEIHFVEVKARTDMSLETPFEAITERKRRRMRKAAKMWLVLSRKRMKGYDEMPCYLSAIGIDMSGDFPEIEFVEDAFV